MAERAPKLEWRERADASVVATVGPLVLIATDTPRPIWRIAVNVALLGKGGGADSLLAAQLAAENAAYRWLSEGVEALGGKVLSREHAELVVRALNAYVAPRHFDDDAKNARALAKELDDAE